MDTQLELDLTRGAAAPGALTRQRLAAAGAALLHWVPVWAPLLFLGQVVVLGLLPAQAESERLERAESEVRARVEELQTEQRELEAETRMLSDEVFRERVRRSLLDPGAPPLTLERARASSRP